MICSFAAGDTVYTSNGDAVLRPFSARVRNEINGDYTLTLVCPNSEKDYVQGNRIIAVDTPSGRQAFRVVKPTFTGTKINAVCRHVSFDAQNYYVASAGTLSNNRTATTALSDLKSAASPSADLFTFATSITGRQFFYVTKVSLQEGLEKIRELWGGEWVRNNYSVTLSPPIYTDHGANIVYRRGLKEISAEYDWSNVVTVLIPVGKDDLTLSAISSQTQYANPFRKMVQFTQDIERESYESDTAYNTALRADLEAQANAYLAAHCVPSVNYTIRGAVDIEGIYDIGDVAHVMDERIGVDIVVRLCAYEYDAIAGRFTELQFGNTKKKLSDLVK